MRVRFAIIVSFGAAAVLMFTAPASAGAGLRAATTHVSSEPSWMSPLVERTDASLLYVSTDGCDCVNVYDQRTRAQVGHIADLAIPYGIATALDGTLWVAENSVVQAFRQGQTRPFVTIPEGSASPIDVAVADDGTLYVDLFGIGSPPEIAVYPKGSTKPSRIISLESVLERTSGITLDHAGNLFATGFVNIDEGRVVEVPAGESRPVVLKPILADPGGIVFDGAGNLLVCDFDDATTYAFKPNGRTTVPDVRRRPHDEPVPSSRSIVQRRHSMLETPCGPKSTSTIRAVSKKGSCRPTAASSRMSLSPRVRALPFNTLPSLRTWKGAS